MKTASELRKGLDEALKPDTSGKTTPIQRLTPFLRDLVDNLEATERQIFFQSQQIRVLMEAHILEHPYEPISSADATEFAPPQKNSESGGASKATA